MTSIGVQFIGIITAFLGWLGALVACGLPQWKVTAFVDANIVTAQTIWEGLWVTCALQGIEQMQCRGYDSMLALSKDLQAARAMIIVSLLVGIIGIIMSIVGVKCNLIRNSRATSVAFIMAGVAFIIAGVLCLIPPSWTAHSIVVDFYNPILMHAHRWDMGASLFISWTAAGFLLLGGALLCIICPR